MGKYLKFLIFFIALRNVCSEIRTEYVEGRCQRATGAAKQFSYKLNATNEQSAVHMIPRPGNEYSRDQDCIFKLESGKKGIKILVNFIKIDFNVPPPPCSSYIRIELGNKSQYCAHDRTKGMNLSVTSPGEFITFYYKTGSEDDRQGRVGFDLVATLFKNAPCDDYFNFQCDGAICISKKFQCDGYANCVDNKDEVGCPSRAGPRKFITFLVIMAWMSVPVRNILF